jgi:hypothetical protein
MRLRLVRTVDGSLAIIREPARDAVRLRVVPVPGDDGGGFRFFAVALRRLRLQLVLDAARVELRVSRLRHADERALVAAIGPLAGVRVRGLRGNYGRAFERRSGLLVHGKRDNGEARHALRVLCVRHHSYAVSAGAFAQERRR